MAGRCASPILNRHLLRRCQLRRTGIQRATRLAVGRAHLRFIGDAIRCWGDDAHRQFGDFAITR